MLIEDTVEVELECTKLALGSLFNLATRKDLVNGKLVISHRIPYEEKRFRQLHNCRRRSHKTNKI